MSTRQPSVLLLLLALGSLLRLIPMVVLQGTPDVGAQIYEGGLVLAGLHPYQDDAIAFGANKAPLGYWIPAVMMLAGRPLGVPDALAVKIPGLAADIAGALILWFGTRRILNRRDRTLTAALFFLNPVSVLMTAYHGNIDPVINVLTLAAFVLALSVPHRWWWPAAALGLAATIKPITFLFVPVFAVVHGGWTRRVAFGLVSIAPFTLAGGYYALTDPGFKRIFAYSSIYGNWGIPLVLQQSQNVIAQLLRSPDSNVVQLLAALNAFVRADGRYVLLAILCGFLGYLAFGASHKAQQNVPGNMVQLLLLFFVFASGFGVQYLSWIVPFMVFYSRRATLLFTSIGGLFLLLTYVQFTLPEKYGVGSVTQNLQILRPADLGLLFAAAAAGLLTWLVCAGLLIRSFSPRRTSLRLAAS